MAVGNGFVNDPSRRGWDEGASGNAQQHFNAVAKRLEALIAERRADVANAMQDYRAQGVSEEYVGKEHRWSQAADNVQDIATKLVASLQTTDGHGAQALSQAGAAVSNIV